MAELADAQERRTAELDAIAAIYGDDVCSRSENSISVRVDGVLAVNVVLPDGDPGRDVVNCAIGPHPSVPHPNASKRYGRVRAPGAATTAVMLPVPM